MASSISDASATAAVESRPHPGPAPVSGGSIQSDPSHGVDARPRAASTDAPKKCRPVDILGTAIMVMFLLAGTLLMSVKAFRDQTISLVDWMQDHQLVGGFAYVGVFAIGASLCFPEVALAIGAGASFSFPVALLTTWLGGILGSLIAFLIGRHCVRGLVSRMCLERSRVLQEVDRAIAKSGWRLVMILRLPYVPFVQMNYLLSASSVSLKGYVVATTIGILPGSALYVYVGHGIRSMAAYVKGHESAGPAPMILTIVGVSVAVISFVVLSLYARRVVKRTLSEQEEELPPVRDSAHNAGELDDGTFATRSTEREPLLAEEADNLP